ncbi:hypothetical protein niasHT_033723 [Heterodera trifolii]|uniref:DUF19 domain-containing protein n=1 Tax=Heterodera trifolii TaxID=157864 RepID=A0ABD2IC11_9BILA
MTLQKLRYFFLLFCYKIQFSTSTWQHKSAEVLDQFMEQQQTNHCDQEAEKEVRHCLQPMLAYANAIQLEDEFAGPPADALGVAPPLPHHRKAKNHRQHFSLQGGAVFRHLCALYTNFNACTESLKCFSPSMRAVEASYGYMCGAGHAAFEQHADCFAEVENREQYVHCKRTASRAMDRATAELGDKSGGIDGEQYMDVLCSTMDDYLHCCRPFVLEMCDVNAWQLVAKITRESLRVSLPNCDLEKALEQPQQQEKQSGANFDNDNEAVQKRPQKAINHFEGID